MNSDETPLFCDRCYCHLTPGGGNFYVVSIEAVADPTPPVFSERDLVRDVKQELNHLISQLEDVSEQEAIDDVYRKLTLYLCLSCFRRWFENPTGQAT